MQANLETAKTGARLRIEPMREGLSGRVRVPGDKSISHRALIFGAIAAGESRVRGFLSGADCLATFHAMRELGADIDMRSADEVWIRGRGLDGLSAPADVVDCGNAGTAMRLLAGLCAGQSFCTQLSGSAQLRRRPMARICVPLRAMGARVDDDGGKAPLQVYGPTPLVGTRHPLDIASAQVKSGLLLAGLYARGDTEIVEPGPSRDHSERLLRAMGVAVSETSPGRVVLSPPTTPLQALDLQVAADPSSAAFVMAAATLVPGSDVLLEGVCINPTRDGFRQALLRMGANIREENPRVESGEPVADLRVRSAPLVAASFSGPKMVTLIDELPLLAAVATQATGLTTLEDAAELRVKETDRIRSTGELLRSMGMLAQERPAGLRITGGRRWRGGTGDSQGDHRLALLFAVMGLVGEEPSLLTQAEVIDDSFPGFESCMNALGARLRREPADADPCAAPDSLKS